MLLLLLLILFLLLSLLLIITLDHNKVGPFLTNLTLNRLLIVEFVMKRVYLGAHYGERQGLMGSFIWI